MLFGGSSAYGNSAFGADPPLPPREEYEKACQVYPIQLWRRAALIEARDQRAAETMRECAHQIVVTRPLKEFAR